MNTLLHHTSLTTPRAVALLTLLVAGSGTGPLLAQPAEAGGAMVYRYALPGQPTLRVNVWGAVRQTGLYEVPTDTDLLGLLSIAGGPDIAVERSREQRNVLIQLSRGSGSRYQVIFEAPLGDVVGQAQALPGLQNGDILTVRTIVQERFGWRDALTIVSAVGTVTYVVLNALRLAYRK